MKSFKYDYTISPENSPQKFKEACKVIENAATDFQKKDLLVDVDGSTIQVYSRNEEKIIVYDDYDIGAVFVKADVELSGLANLALN